MKMQKISRALVCDEFGICTGIITLRDILEGLVGNVDDPEEEPDIIKRVNKEGWLVDGQCSLYDFLCYFNRSDLFEASEYHTLGDFSDKNSSFREHCYRNIIYICSTE